MNRFLILSLSLIIGTTAHAESNYRSDSELGDVCIAALESRDAAKARAAELGIAGFDITKLRCNGKPVRQWVQLAQAQVEPMPVTLNPADESPATELCVAALVSEQEFEATKQRLFKNSKRVEKQLQCNGKSLKRFAMQYEESLARL